MHLHRHHDPIPAAARDRARLHSPARLRLAPPEPHCHDVAQALPATPPCASSLGTPRISLLRPRLQARRHVSPRDLRQVDVPIPPLAPTTSSPSCTYSRRRHAACMSTPPWCSVCRCWHLNTSAPRRHPGSRCHSGTNTLQRLVPGMYIAAPCYTAIIHDADACHCMSASDAATTSVGRPSPAPTVEVVAPPPSTSATDPADAP